jgi:hypothetical protein
MNPDLSLFKREREALGGTVYGSPNSDRRRVRSGSPLPAQSRERIKVRGPSDCIVTAKPSAFVRIWIGGLFARFFLEVIP